MRLNYVPNASADQHGYLITIDGVTTRRQSISPLQEIDATGDEVSVVYIPLSKLGKPLAEPVTIGEYKKPKPVKPVPTPQIVDRHWTDAKFRLKQRIKLAANWAMYRRANDKQ